MSSVIGDSLDSTEVIQIWIENDCFEVCVSLRMLQYMPRDIGCCIKKKPYLEVVLL